MLTLLITLIAAPPASIAKDAKSARPLIKSALGNMFLDAAASLPTIAARTLHHNADKSRWYTQAERDRLPKAEQAGLTAFEVDAEKYYTTKYGSPISYARPLEVLSAHGLSALKGKKVLDFGYGYVTHLAMFRTMGADASGVDVDPMLRTLYSEERVRLHHGRFPADASIVRDVGVGFDLIISKNVLKRGYIHPERPADPKKLIDLGVTDEKFLAALNAALKPGGLMLVYNLFPAQAPSDKPYIPWADGRSPFTKAQWEAAGFTVIAFDVNDDANIRALAHALGWDQPEDGEPGMDLEHDLFALYSLFKKR